MDLKSFKKSLDNKTNLTKSEGFEFLKIESKDIIFYGKNTDKIKFEKKFNQSVKSFDLTNPDVKFPTLIVIVLYEEDNTPIFEFVTKRPFSTRLVSNVYLIEKSKLEERENCIIKKEYIIDDFSKISLIEGNRRRVVQEVVEDTERSFNTYDTSVFTRTKSFFNKFSAPVTATLVRSNSIKNVVKEISKNVEVKTPVASPRNSTSSISLTKSISSDEPLSLEISKRLSSSKSDDSSKTSLSKSSSIKSSSVKSDNSTISKKSEESTNSKRLSSTELITTEDILVSPKEDKLSESFNSVFNTSFVPETLSPKMSMKSGSFSKHSFFGNSFRSDSVKEIPTLYPESDECVDEDSDLIDKVMSKFNEQETNELVDLFPVYNRTPIQKQKSVSSIDLSKDSLESITPVKTTLDSSKTISLIDLPNSFKMSLDKSKPINDNTNVQSSMKSSMKMSIRDIPEIPTKVSFEKVEKTSSTTIPKTSIIRTHSMDMLNKDNDKIELVDVSLIKTTSSIRKLPNTKFSISHINNSNKEKLIDFTEIYEPKIGGPCLFNSDPFGNISCNIDSSIMQANVPLKPNPIELQYREKMELEKMDRLLRNNSVEKSFNLDGLNDLDFDCWNIGNSTPSSNGQINQETMEKSFAEITRHGSEHDDEFDKSFGFYESPRSPTNSNETTVHEFSEFDPIYTGEKFASLSPTFSFSTPNLSGSKFETISGIPESNFSSIFSSTFEQSNCEEKGHRVGTTEDTISISQSEETIDVTPEESFVPEKTILPEVKSSKSSIRTSFRNSIKNSFGKKDSIKLSITKQPSIDLTRDANKPVNKSIDKSINKSVDKSTKRVDRSVDKNVDKSITDVNDIVVSKESTLKRSDSKKEEQSMMNMFRNSFRNSFRKNSSITSNKSDFSVMGIETENIEILKSPESESIITKRKESLRGSLSTPNLFSGNKDMDILNFFTNIREKKKVKKKKGKKVDTKTEKNVETKSKNSPNNSQKNMIENNSFQEKEYNKKVESIIIQNRMKKTQSSNLENKILSMRSKMEHSSELSENDDFQ
ncbi:hypothetical protein [Carp edema virus]|nr:hypothetical protein [Carp edema virus]